MALLDRALELRSFPRDPNFKTDEKPSFLSVFFSSRCHLSHTHGRYEPDWIGVGFGGYGGHNDDEDGGNADDGVPVRQCQR